MNSVIEKITLYDFFGYLLPGMTFLSLLAVSFFCYFGTSMPQALSNCNSILITLFLLWGFLCGIILSELARRILNGIEKAFFKETYEEKAVRSAGIDESQMNKLLKKTGIINSKSASRKKDIVSYLPMIYADIQTDDKYKRIHNYASSETMYKNLAAALFFGGMPEFIFLLLSEYHTCLKVVVILIWLASVMVLILRYYRFRLKKYVYSILWFVDKYKGENDN